ncbi:hypothetical protein PINS_up015642 [Pythium insidiosum]|nr:hypothetical protein PINS_up015642 [Pythium insidiosum]
MVGVPDDQIKFTPFSLIGGNISLVGSLIGGIKDTKDMLGAGGREERASRDHRSCR